MRRGLRADREGVASTVATLFSILVFLLFFQLAVLGPIPRQQYDAEWETSHRAIEALAQLRAWFAGPATPGAEFSVPVRLGTFPVSPLAAGSPGYLELNTSTPGPTLSFRFIPNFYRAGVTKVDQDVILLMDSSGSMAWNDPKRLRIAGAKEYVAQLQRPDRVAIVDFDSVAHFTWANVGGPVHHLDAYGHNGNPDYAEAQSDLDTIDARGGTNFGDAIRIANGEFAANGDPKHAWVMILLTDGRNNFRWQDNLARTEAQRAKARGITIYTIGLGSAPNGRLLSEIAATTGGTYYAAPDASSLHWIYLELSRRYRSSFSCGLFSTADVSLGSLSLSLSTHQYPAQAVRLEGGGLAIVQSDGAFLEEGLPFEYEPSGRGSGSLTVVAPTFLGTSSSASGVDTEIVQARLVAYDPVEQTIVRVDLSQEAVTIGNISAGVQSWADRGAATPAGARAVRAPLDEARDAVATADVQASSGEIAAAKFAVDHAQARLADAIAEAEKQAAARRMQNWLAAATKDDALAEACRLDQWRNWYDGITMEMTTPAATAWARWFNETFRPMGAFVDVGVSGDRVVVSFHAIDRFVLDRRIVRLWLGGQAPARGPR